MARMGMDCNLKNLANFFKFFLCLLEKSPKKKLITVCPSQEKSLSVIFFVIQEQFDVREKVSCQIFE